MLQVLILTLYGLAGLTGLGFVAGVMVWAFDGTMNAEAMGALALLTLVWIGIGVTLQRLMERPRQQLATTTNHKAKRGETDMYSMIDRLVHELNAAERNYLQRRLDETVDQTDDDDALDVTLEALLSEREARRLTD
jgi:hypothetical protein